MADRHRIAIDLQPLQGHSSRDRGIGRYILGQVKSIAERHPDSVHSLLVNPNRGLPPEITAFLDTDLVLPHTQTAPLVDGVAPDVYYITSPFEFDLTLDEIWPLWARTPSVRTVATLYDLIPMLFQDHYLSDSIWTSLYWARREFISHTDLLLSISEATAIDGRRLLDLPENRVVNISTGVSEHFSPPIDPDHVISAAVDTVDGLRPGFIMYTGGIDYRKNIPGILEAYSLLPARIRRDRQLVIVCRVLPSERDSLMTQARELGIDGDLLLTGFVPDETLALLYQAASLFVFPSIYEGFGLPIAEAILSGTLAIASDSSSMVEIVTDPDFRFDPESPADIARCIAYAVDLPNAEQHRERQYAHVAQHFQWDAVADRTINAISALPEVHVPRVPARNRPRIGIVTPVPPAESGIADYSWHLIHALAAYVDVDVVAEDPQSQAIPHSVHVNMVTGPGFLERDRLLRYDAAVYVMGNSSHHAQAFDLMSHRPGSVMIHEARFTGFFEWWGRYGGHGAQWFHNLLHSEYQGIQPDLGEIGWLTWNEASDGGLYLLGPIIDEANQVLTTSAFAANLARLQRPERSDAITDIGFAYPLPEPSDLRRKVRWIATFGYQHEIKATDVVVGAFARLAKANPDVRLAIVGDIAAELSPTLESVIAERTLADRVVMTGRVDADTYASWLREADIAVQLRRATNGEVSAAVGDCLRFGIPTIVTGLGPARDLPDDAVAKIAAPPEVEALADAIETLLLDPERRRSLSTNAKRFTAAQSFDDAALKLLEAVQINVVENE